MHGFFGEIEISEESHERRQNATRLGSIESLNGRAELFGHGRQHDAKLANGWLDNNSRAVASDQDYSLTLLFDVGISERIIKIL